VDSSAAGHETGQPILVALVADTLAGLGNCTARQAGTVGYVTSTFSLYACANRQWRQIPCGNANAGDVAYESTTQTLLACEMRQWIPIATPQGEPGADGHDSLLSQDDEPAGGNCSAGGVRIDSGLDVDDDGVLDPEEVEQTSYVCNATSCDAASGCPCVPDCSGRQCGADGCGGICGTCAAGESCSWSGTCECVPDCSGRECGGDGCGGVCGSCPPSEACSWSGTCGCIPDCSGRQCGDDGCGGSCGACPGECLNGATQECYSGPPGTAGLGTCWHGTQTCTDGAFGACSGEVVPAAETCANEGADNDCDAVPDDVAGRDQFCLVSENLGICRIGTAQCRDGNLVCVTPVPSDDAQTAGETACDGRDEDCDGAVDDGFDLQVDADNCGQCGLACGDGVSCCGGECVQLESDVEHCGMCGNACGNGVSCCAGSCVDTQTDAAHCGGCGIDCVSLGTELGLTCTCTTGVCASPEAPCAR
jgi:hypothetical protein